MRDQDWLKGLRFDILHSRQLGTPCLPAELVVVVVQVDGSISPSLSAVWWMAPVVVVLYSSLHQNVAEHALRQADICDLVVQ